MPTCLGLVPDRISRASGRDLGGLSLLGMTHRAALSAVNDDFDSDAGIPENLFNLHSQFYPTRGLIKQVRSPNRQPSCGRSTNLPA